MDSAVGQCHRVNHMVGNWVDHMVGNRGNCVVDKRGVVDNGGNVMEDRVGNNLVAHLVKIVGKIYSGGNFIFFLTSAGTSTTDLTRGAWATAWATGRTGATGATWWTTG